MKLYPSEESDMDVKRKISINHAATTAAKGAKSVKCLTKDVAKAAKKLHLEAHEKLHYAEAWKREWLVERAAR